jgi:hypothetical protein
MTHHRLSMQRLLAVTMTAGMLAGAFASAGLAAEPTPGDPKYRGARGGHARPATPQTQQRQAPPQAVRQQPAPSIIVRQAPAPQVRVVPQQRYQAVAPRPYYESGRRDGHGGRGYNRGIAIGVGAAIIGATLGYRYYRGPNRDNVYDRCDRNFPEFDYDTGTFTNDDGERELCPYLRAYVD